MILACDFKWNGWLSKWHGVSMKYISIFTDWEGCVEMDSTWHMKED